ncbi:uncharacterized protein LOC109859141 isoform X2 [Pseudomyrmex gracilis]|uniref:uncharacterized protein LOC109859141 isoform X2 n=1 Tax=Pseudomyrmex gracilis TaxID=219809 RepID=UPI000994F529|nr:uncharacterized protein LOC109859141 isoform X2 [Pseudomyrmex gracilis]
MPEEPNVKVSKQYDVWCICNKIRNSLFRVGCNLWEYYKSLDPDRRSSVSESEFISVLAGPLNEILDLSDKEICDLAVYFKTEDDRVNYERFCEVVYDSVFDFEKDKFLVNDSKCEDLQYINALSGTELQILNLILTQITVLVIKSQIALQPYFQNYEMIAKSNGTITLAHFGRILKFLGIILGPEEFRLVVKRFAQNAYAIDYVSFLKAIEEIQCYLEKHGMAHLSKDLLYQFPGRIITAEIPKLPRPEIGKVIPSQVFGKQSVFHPVMEPAKEAMSTKEVIQRIQRHVFEHRIRIHEFLKDFDCLNSGRINVSQFRRALDALQISSLGRLFLRESEITDLIELYKDPGDPDRVCWRTFEDDIDKVFTVKGLDKLPNMKVESPPQEIIDLPRKGASNWHCEPKSTRELCEDVLQRVRQRVEERRIYLKPFFKNYDKPDFIEYVKFATAVEEAVTIGGLEKTPLLTPIQHVPSEERVFLNFNERLAVAAAMDKLCKIPNPNLEEIFQDYDKENIGTVSKEQWMKALSVRRMLELISNKELDAIQKCFSIERGNRFEINYRAFLRTLYILQENKKIMIC